MKQIPIFLFLFSNICNGQQIDVHNDWRYQTSSTFRPLFDREDSLKMANWTDGHIAIRNDTIYFHSDSIRYYLIYGYSSAYHGLDQQFESVYLDSNATELPVYNIHSDKFLDSLNGEVYFYWGDSIKYDSYLHKVLAIKRRMKWIPIYYSYWDKYSKK